MQTKSTALEEELYRGLVGEKGKAIPPFSESKLAAQSSCRPQRREGDGGAVPRAPRVSDRRVGPAVYHREKREGEAWASAAGWAVAATWVKREGRKAGVGENGPRAGWPGHPDVGRGEELGRARGKGEREGFWFFLFFYFKSHLKLLF